MATSSSWTSRTSCPTLVGTQLMPTQPSVGLGRGTPGLGNQEGTGEGLSCLSLSHTEPSADLIMNVSRCRRLIVVLSVAYLEQDWCNSSFRYEPAPVSSSGRGGSGPSPSCPMPDSQGRPLEVAGALQETHLHRLREPVPGDHAPCHQPAEAAQEPGDLAGVACWLHGKSEVPPCQHPPFG